MEWAKPEAYPVLGEEPCRDMAYVLGTAGPAWCSRCSPQNGRERKDGQRRPEKKAIVGERGRWREEKKEEREE